MSSINKVVLAYSGGLDTSVILRWLQDEYQCEVVTFTADLGQGEEVEPARAKAKLLGIRDEDIFIEDLREEFVRDFVYPMMRCNTIYEGEYLLGTSIARPLIAKRLVEIPIEQKRGGKSPYSMDANLLHISFEGDQLEDPWVEAEDDMWRWTVAPEQAPDAALEITLSYAAGDIVAIDGKTMSPAEVLTHLNKVGGEHGVGRDDIVENRYVGMKSRGCYETPGGTIMLKAHRAIESITLDREVAHLKDELMPRYASVIYNGYWWSPERKMLQAAIDHSQDYVNGDVRLKLYKGSVSVLGRQSNDSLFDEKIATFEDDEGAYHQRDAEGFIKLNALRMRIAGRKRP